MSHDFDPIQEDDVVATRSVSKVGIVSILVGAAGVFVAGVIQVVVIGTMRPTAVPRHETQTTAPREISHIQQTQILAAPEGLDLRARERDQLQRYGWVDRKRGIAAIPIDRAIDILVERERR
jgi:hypothetical protein